MKRGKLVTLLSALALPLSTSAQNAPQPADSAPRIDLSGIMFANYQYRLEAEAGSANKFDLERAYLTVRAPAGNRAAIRLTTDVFQQTTSGSDVFYRGWAIRAKYAYVQYTYLDGAWKSAARLGLLQTVFIEHDESFWPRWIANSPTERAGFFSSADAGLANSILLPGSLGEVYATVTNGPGYTSREVDRFKDAAARLTLTPWRRDKGSPLRSLALSVWGYKGAVASRFVSGGPGQIGPIGDALRRDRWGVHAGISTPRVTSAAQYGQRIDGGETGLNTAASPRQVVDSTGSVLSAYALVRPFARSGEDRPPHPLSLLARIDRVSVNHHTDDAYDFIIGGLVWDLNERLSASLDYQEAKLRAGSPVSATRTLFAHFVARF